MADEGAATAGPPTDDGSGEPPVSSTLQRLWGRDAPRRRGPKPALSVERVVGAAMEVADAEGLEAVSMARVAESLGYSSMALYRYVASKDELLALMADAVAADLVLPAYPTGDWRAGLEAWTRAQIDLILARPWFIDLPLPAVRLGPNRVRWIDTAFAVLGELDLTPDEKLQIIGLLAQHVLGEGRVQVETRRAAADAVRRERGLPEGTPESELDQDALDRANPYYDFETVLQHFATPETHPHLFAALSTSPPPPAPRHPDGWEDDFGVSLQIVLDGVVAFVEQRLASRR
ncbi:TetR/AcrR family transcriptional regulator [Cellulosimicrobium cellulans]|uniref:TetR/AcrR family transcriptional regulator n=1 Tax=Cellulosimicrobium cellulans TaxID=1710 RepID=UPI0009F545D0|nr:helix-turn-helix domain-containing protein [Cellulosimicrobium cellulans]